MVLSRLTIKTEEHRITNAAQLRTGDSVARRVNRPTGPLHLRGRQRARVQGHFVAQVYQPGNHELTEHSFDGPISPNPRSRRLGSSSLVDDTDETPLGAAT